MKSAWIPNILNAYIATEASTIGNTQYPSTQIHWKKDIWPPNSLVLTVTTNAPPHIIKNRTPNDFPLSWVYIPRFKILICKIVHTMREANKILKVPTNPLNNNSITIP